MAAQSSGSQDVSPARLWMMATWIFVLPIVAGVIVGCWTSSFWWALAAAPAAPIAVLAVLMIFWFLTGWAQGPTMRELRQQHEEQIAKQTAALAAEFDLPNPRWQEQDRILQQLTRAGAAKLPQ